MIDMKQNLLKIMENKRNVCLTTITKGNTQSKEKPIYKYLFFMLYISFILPLGDLI